MFFTRQMIIAISATRRAIIGGPELPMIHRSLQVMIYYYCLLTFCFHELDVLIESDYLLLNVHANQEIPIFNSPPRNHIVDELFKENA